MITIGFTDIASALFLCQKDYLNILSDNNDKIKQNRDVYLKANNNDSKGYYKQLLTIVEKEYPSLNSNFKERINLIKKLLPSVNIIIKNNLEAYMKNEENDFPHLLITCPIKKTNVQKIPLESNFVYLFQTSIIDGKHWVDKCRVYSEIEGDKRGPVKIKCSKTGHCDVMDECEVIPACIDKNDYSCLFKEAYQKFINKYESMEIVRPSDAILVIKFMADNWNYLKDRAKPELEPEIKKKIIAEMIAKEQNFNLRQ